LQIDLCRGPHLRSTGNIKAFELTKSSSAYWKGDSQAESLQRVYGISFYNSKRLVEWKNLQEAAAMKDHRKLGKDQARQKKLVFFLGKYQTCISIDSGAFLFP